VAASDFRDLRAWQLAHAFKLGIYALISRGSLVADFRLSGQLREAAASVPSNIAEGFGRFDPADFARLVKVAKASLVECQNHLQDAVDRRHISRELCGQHDAKAKEVLREVAGLLDYLQSPDAKRNAEKIRQSRIARRQQRVASQKQKGR
jgi:four helix bundle protein